MRIAVLFDNFGPYHIARLQAASAKAKVLGVQVRKKSAIYEWQTSSTEARFEQGVLFERTSENANSAASIFSALDRVVAPFQPDVIAVPGWSTGVFVLAADWANARAIPMVVMSESNEFDFPRSKLSEWVKRLQVSSYSAGLCGSGPQMAYLLNLGLPKASVFDGYNAVDNNYFSQQTDMVRENGEMPMLAGGKRLEAKWKDRYFLASARFIEKKNLLSLLEAYAIYRRNVGDKQAWPLVLLGDGPLRPKLEAFCERLALESSVHMPGFRQYEELPKFYATAGAFVHASTTEQWGLVVNEAMASGLPVLVSKKCGCVSALVQDGKNGYAFDPRDVCQLASLLERISGDKAKRSAFAQQSRRIIEDWGPQRFADGLFKAAKFAREDALPIENSVMRKSVTRLIAWYQIKRLANIVRTEGVDATKAPSVDLVKQIDREATVDEFTARDGSIKFFSFVQALIMKTRAQQVLDFGAGRAAFWYQDASVYRRQIRDLRVHGPHVTAADIDPVVLSHPCSDRQVVLEPGKPLPFEDASFDVVVSDMTFEHIEDAKGVSSELRRVVKPGGWVCARTPNKHGYVTWLSRLVPNRLHAKFLTRVQPDRQSKDVFDAHYKMNDPASIRSLFPEWDVSYFRDSADPAYFFGNKWLYRCFLVLHRLLPPVLATTICFFVRKPEEG